MVHFFDALFRHPVTLTFPSFPLFWYFDSLSLSFPLFWYFDSLSFPLINLSFSSLTSESVAGTDLFPVQKHSLLSTREFDHKETRRKSLRSSISVYYYYSMTERTCRFEVDETHHFIFSSLPRIQLWFQFWGNLILIKLNRIQF